MFSMITGLEVQCFVGSSSPLWYGLERNIRTSSKKLYGTKFRSRKTSCHSLYSSSEAIEWHVLLHAIPGKHCVGKTPAVQYVPHINFGDPNHAPGIGRLTTSDILAYEAASLSSGTGASSSFLPSNADGPLAGIGLHPCASI